MTGRPAIVPPERVKVVQERAEEERRQNAALRDTNERFANEIERLLRENAALRQNAANPARLRELAGPPPEADAGPEREVIVTSASAIAPRPVRWLWEHRVPLGKLAIGAGRQGQGKSLLTITLTAMVSNGTCPGDMEGQPGTVLLVTGEDDPEDTIVPRLIAAGADRARVGIVDVRERVNGAPVKGPISLPGDVPRLADVARERGASLVIFDPVVGFLDRDHSAINNQDTRRALAPLKGLAEDLGCAVLAIMHLNKAGGTDALARIADSTAFTALARSVLLFGPDPEDADGERGARKVLTVPKSNLAAPGAHGLAMRIEPRTIHDDAGEPIATPRLVIVGPSGASASDLLTDPDDRSALRDACAFLRAELAAGPVPAKDVEAAAEEADIARRTLRRAKEQLRVRTEKQRVAHGIWMWVLPPAIEGAHPVPTSPDWPPWPSSSKGGQEGQDIEVVGGGQRHGHLPSGPRGPHGEDLFS
jgi:hypothetical protein